MSLPSGMLEGCSTMILWFVRVDLFLSKGNIHYSRIPTARCIQEWCLAAIIRLITIDLFFQLYKIVSIPEGTCEILDLESLVNCHGLPDSTAYTYISDIISRIFPSIFASNVIYGVTDQYRDPAHLWQPVKNDVYICSSP